jgi:hypothetical protein
MPNVMRIAGTCASVRAKVSKNVRCRERGVAIERVDRPAAKRGAESHLGGGRSESVSKATVKKWSLALLIALPLGLAAQMTSIARVTALADGRLLLNGQPSSLAAIEDEFKRLQAAKGAVMYHRENARSEAGPVAMSVIDLVKKYGLPISLSSKSDFSDYIDASGQSHPRPTDQAK